LPALSRAKESGRRAACMSNMRQLYLGAGLYAEENEGLFPPRLAMTHWPKQLQEQIGNLRVMICPSDQPVGTSDTDPDQMARSYVMNVFSDYFSSTLSP